MMFAPRPKGLGKESFLKLNDQEEITGVFRGEIYLYKRHWINKRGIECSGESCPVCKADAKKENYPSFRFRINFITSKDGQWIAKIFEGGSEVYDSLTRLDKKHDLSKTAVEITRAGLGTSTKYHILPLKDYPMTKELEATLKSVTLKPLHSETEN